MMSGWSLSKKHLSDDGVQSTPSPSVVPRIPVQLIIAHKLTLFLFPFQIRFCWNGFVPEPPVHHLLQDWRSETEPPQVLHPKVMSKAFPSYLETLEGIQCNQFFIRAHFCKNPGGIQANFQQKSGQNPGKNPGEMLICEEKNLIILFQKMKNWAKIKGIFFLLSLIHFE